MEEKRESGNVRFPSMLLEHDEISVETDLFERTITKRGRMVLRVAIADKNILCTLHNHAPKPDAGYRNRSGSFLFIDVLERGKVTEKIEVSYRILFERQPKD